MFNSLHNHTLIQYCGQRNGMRPKLVRLRPTDGVGRSMHLWIWSFMCMKVTFSTWNSKYLKLSFSKSSQSADRTNSRLGTPLPHYPSEETGLLLKSLTFNFPFVSGVSPPLLNALSFLQVFSFRTHIQPFGSAASAV